MEGKKSGKYPPGLRAFALSLHFYSPRAYNFLREELGTLPTPRTMRGWYSKIDTEPGMSSAAIEALNSKINQEKATGKKEIFAALMMDEMAIRPKMCWDPQKKKFRGFENYGMPNLCKTKRKAKEVLVFLINAVNGRWKIPVAYFLTAGLNGETKAQLVLDVLRFLSTVDMRIISLTFDGHPANRKMVEELTSLKFGSATYFLHPVQGHKVHIIFDAAHMIKLMRNYFAKPHLIKDDNGDYIEWKYVQRLHMIQQEMGLHFGNKLRSPHINYIDNIMSVKLAAQTLSHSVAVSLEFCRLLEISGFEDSKGTIKFVDMMDKVIL